MTQIFIHYLLQQFKKFSKKTFYSFILLVLSHPAFAITVPSDLGKIHENIQGRNGKTLILIEEAHVDYGAQKSIAGILKALIEKEHLHLIMVEGGWGDVNLDYLRSYGSTEGRLKVSEQYLKDGKISGEEYLNVTTELPMELWGIEDKALYDGNMRAFLKIDEKQKALREELAKLKETLLKRSEGVFSQDLKAFLNKKEAFEEQHSIGLLDYLSFLTKTPSANISQYPHLQKVLNASGLGAGFDIEKVDLEKRELIGALSRSLTKPELELLSVLSEKKSSEEESRFLGSLFETFRRFPKLEQKYPAANLRAYAKALREVEGVESDKMFEEIAALEKTLGEKLAPAKDAKELLQSFQALTDLKKLFELKLGPKDYEALEKSIFSHCEEADPKGLLRGGRRSNLHLKPDCFASLAMTEDLQQAIPLARAFYTAALAREKALIQNAQQHFEKSKEPVAAVIIGGFHAKALTEAFKAKGYNVLLIAPQFTAGDSSASQENYFKILKYKWNPNLSDFSQGGISQHAIQ